MTSQCADKGDECALVQKVAASRPARRAPAVARWKKLCFSLLTTAAFFLLFEALLAAFGVRPLLDDEDPYVGFSSRIPLFVERVNERGELSRVTADNRLRLFNRQEFPAHKSPGTYRVFCLGGSTTYGHPYRDETSFAGWLREYLPAADPSRRWEVINAGGISYASYRVTLLMEELVHYQPDLFIIYTGHNEFLESRTYGDMRDSHPLVRGVHERLAATRTFSLLHRQLQTGQPAIGTAQEREMLPAEVDAILDRAVGPRSYRRDEKWQADVVEHFRYSLRRMAALAESAGARIIYVTPASNLRDFEPFKSEHLADLPLSDVNIWRGLIHQAGEAFETGEYHQALNWLDRAAKTDDRYARLHFLRGRVLYRLERYTEAKRAYQRARDEDVCPLRALTPMEAMVAEVAAEVAAPCVDYVTLLEGLSTHGIPGEDWFLDHVHPSIEGYRLLGLELIRTMQAQGWVRPDNSWNEAAIDLVTRRVLERLDPREHANALRVLAKTLRWAGKFDQSARLSLLAVQGLQGDGEAHVLAGDAWWRQGNLEAAEAEYLQAIAADPNDLWTLLQLGGVLLQQGEAGAAVNYLERGVRIADDRADAHLLLARALLALEEREQAEAAFHEALRLDPQLADAHKQLAMIAVGQDDISNAISHLEQALTIDPADVTAHCELGWLFLAQGQTALAGDEFRLAALLDPNLPRVQSGLTEVAAIEERQEDGSESPRLEAELNPGSEVP